MNNYVLAGQAEAKDRIIERAKIYADFTTTEEGTYLADQGEAVEYEYGQYDGAAHGIRARITGIKNGERITFTLSDNFELKGIISQVTQIADNSEYVFASAGSGRYQLLLSAVYNASGSVYADKGNYLFDQSSARYYAARTSL